MEREKDQSKLVILDLKKEKMGRGVQETGQLADIGMSGLPKPRIWLVSRLVVLLVVYRFLKFCYRWLVRAESALG